MKNIFRIHGFLVCITSILRNRVGLGRLRPRRKLPLAFRLLIHIPNSGNHRASVFSRLPGFEFQVCTGHVEVLLALSWLNALRCRSVSWASPRKQRIRIISVLLLAKTPGFLTGFGVRLTKGTVDHGEYVGIVSHDNGDFRGEKGFDGDRRVTISIFDLLPVRNIKFACPAATVLLLVTHENSGQSFPSHFVQSSLVFRGRRLVRNLASKRN